MIAPYEGPVSCLKTSLGFRVLGLGFRVCASFTSKSCGASCISKVSSMGPYLGPLGLLGFFSRDPSGYMEGI